jgi:hypothetical protein
MFISDALEEVRSRNNPASRPTADVPDVSEPAICGMLSPAHARCRDA